MATFSDRFKEQRLVNGSTQMELVTNFNRRYNRNLTPAAISQYENGKRKPEVDALQDFAEFFGVSIDYLLGINNNPYTVAIHTGSELTTDELKEVQNFIDYLISKRE